MGWQEITSCHGLLSGRSWIDTFSASVYLDDFEWPSHIKQLLGAGKPSRNWLPAWLHEGTHHWCFYSPVGNTLAMLQARARWRARAFIEQKKTRRLGGREMENEILWDLSEDVLRPLAAMALLEPIAEGLALFMEFDAWVGNAASISTPMQMAGLFFLSPEKWQQWTGQDLTGKEVSIVMTDLLLGTRLTESYVRRKVNLLGQPLSCAGSGYLAGYLTVKLLYRIGIRRCSAFTDPDLFASFLKKWIFDDFGFVAKLLDPATSDIGTVDALQEHFQQRLAEWITADLNALVPAFDKYTSNPVNPSEPLDIDFQLGGDEWQHLRGWERYLAIGDEWETPPPIVQAYPSTLETWCFYRQVLSQREWVRMGLYELKIRVTKSHQAIALLDPEQMQRHGVSLEPELIKKHGGFFIFSAGALPNVSVGEGDGRLEIYVSVKTFEKLLIMTRGSEKVLCSIMQWPITTEHERLAAEHIISAQFEDRDAVHQRFIEEAMSDSLPLSAMSMAMSAAKEIASTIYVNKALAQVPIHMIEWCFDPLWLNGIYGLLGKNLLKLQDAARFSLIAAFTADKTEQIQLALSCGWDDCIDISEFQAVSRTRGFQMFEDLGKAVWSWI